MPWMASFLFTTIICGREIGMRLVPAPDSENGVVRLEICWVIHCCPLWYISRYCGMVLAESRQYVAIYGWPASSALMEVELISSLFCGMRQAYSAVVAVIGKVYFSPVLFSQVRPPSFDRA